MKVVRQIHAVFVEALLLPVRVYRWLLSPLLPKACRFYPSCSAYAMEALKTHGAVKGIWLSALRLSRCHPFHEGGFDPVPQVTAKEQRNF